MPSTPSGVTGPLDPALAADGVAEVVDTMAPRQVRLGRAAAPPHAIRLCAGDTGSSWILGPGEPVATMDATAATLLLVLWGRLPADDPAVTWSGDQDRSPGLSQRLPRCPEPPAASQGRVLRARCPGQPPQDSTVDNVTGTDAIVEHILTTYDTITVVGASAAPAKAAHYVPAHMQRHGWRIIPVNLRADVILGEPVYRALRDVPEQIGLVNLFRPSEQTPDFARQAVAAGATAFWLQLGIASAETRAIAEDAGLLYVEDRCPDHRAAPPADQRTRLPVAGQDAAAADAAVPDEPADRKYIRAPCLLPTASGRGQWTRPVH